jgi:ABC-type thiamine transport system substrate-binding protein
MIRLSNTLFAAAILGTVAGAASAAEVVIYNASDSVNTPLVEAFKVKHPGIEVKFVSGSTGPITERAIAEKAKPQADVVYLVNNVALVDAVERELVSENPCLPGKYREIWRFAARSASSNVGITCDHRCLR